MLKDNVETSLPKPRYLTSNTLSTNFQMREYIAEEILHSRVSSAKKLGAPEVFGIFEYGHFAQA